MRAFLRLWILIAATVPLPAQIKGVWLNRVASHVDLMETEDEYLTTDLRVQARVLVAGHKGDKLRFEWWNPMGQPQDKPSDSPAESFFWIWPSLPIAGSPHAYQPGEWQFRTYWNGTLVDVKKFRISLPPDSPLQFLTGTALPRATVGRRYYLQFTIRGGTPPYRWTAIKAAPGGLALSPDGIITGTPEKPGVFRVVVKAEDSAGNSVTRAAGFVVQAPAAEAPGNVKLLTRSLLKSTGADGCSNNSVQADFAATGTVLALTARLDGEKTRHGAFEWLNPRGEVAQTTDFNKTLDGPECFVNTLAVAGNSPASDPGEWRARVLWMDSEVFSENFTIRAAEGRIAFLIANRAYQKLPAAGPPDANVRALETTLRDDGFQVVSKTDLTLKAIDAFEESLGTAVHSGDTVFVYYAGHGIPSGGDLWMAPVEFDPADTRPLDAKAYSVLRLRDYLLEYSKAKLKFLVLDASRLGTGTGLDSGSADSTTTIVQSGGSRSGAFARALAETLSHSGTTAKAAFETELPKALVAIERSGQRPVVFVGGGGNFVFRESARTPPPAPAHPKEEPPEKELQGAAGTQWTNPKDGLTYIWIPPGTFQMGCSVEDSECRDYEKPLHPVAITTGFWMGQTEVTQAAWQRVMRSNPSHFRGEKLPVESVDWNGAQDYCQKAGLRLPTEAEWEYAARAGNSSPRYGDLDAIAWYVANSGEKSHEVAGKQPNRFGLYDMLGNVWEWVADWYAGYSPGAATNPQGPASGTIRPVRGGGWSSSAMYARAANRGRYQPIGYDRVGFRCAGNR